jgi:formylmethanofuran dehydrogenase subunit E
MHEARAEREIARLPRCDECELPIVAEECWEFNGELICPDCLRDNHRKLVDDYVE